MTLANTSRVIRGLCAAVLVAASVVHGGGMTLKYRLEKRQGPVIWWERLLFWICWAGLAGLVAWIGLTLVRI
jgi:hypothetical protein